MTDRQRDHHGTSARTRYLVAGGTAVVFAVLVTWSVVTAWHPLAPRLVCVEPLGNGQTAAYFGYTNALEEAQSEPVGDDNYFSPGELDRHQPVAFASKAAIASKKDAFAVAFSGDSLTWSLRGRAVKATPRSTRCPLPPQKENVAWVKPKPPEPPPVVKPPEPPKPEPEPPKPEEPKEAPKPEPKLAAQAPRPKPKEVLKEQPKPPEPVPLAIEGLTNLQGGMAMQSGETTTLGSAEVEANKDNTKPQAAGTTHGTPAGTGQTDGGQVKRTAPKVKVRPKGEWPADAPPRAGAVLVKLSLLVGTNGKVKEVRVVKSAGAVFDREAKRVGALAVFEPATVGDEPVEQWVPWVVEFTPVEQ